MSGAYILQYDMGLRTWVLTAPDGTVLETYVSRDIALRDRMLRRVASHAVLRIRNADGSFMPASVPRDAARGVETGQPLVADV